MCLQLSVARFQFLAVALHKREVPGVQSRLLHGSDAFETFTFDPFYLLEFCVVRTSSIYADSSLKSFFIEA